MGYSVWKDWSQKFRWVLMLKWLARSCRTFCGSFQIDIKFGLRVWLSSQKGNVSYDLLWHNMDVMSSRVRTPPQFWAPLFLLKILRMAQHLRASGDWTLAMEERCLALDEAVELKSGEETGRARWEWSAAPKSVLLASSVITSPALYYLLEPLPILAVFSVPA